jgi:fermentation-respiration switch protein FrsA (DUF1100 family)
MYEKVRCNFLIVAYRGYSNSEGVPSEAGIQLDGRAIMDYAVSRKDKIDTNNLFVLGRSLGGAVAISALFTGEYKIRGKISTTKGLIIENTFTSIDSMVDKIFPYIAFLKGPVLRNHWRSIERINHIKTPIMFIIAMNDELVPPRMMQELFEKATNARHRVKVEIHSDLVRDRGGWAQWILHE